MTESELEKLAVQMFNQSNPAERRDLLEPIGGIGEATLAALDRYDAGSDQIQRFSDLMQAYQVDDVRCGLIRVAFMAAAPEWWARERAG